MTMSKLTEQVESMDNNKVKIFCCSRSRYKNVTTLKVVANVTLVVNHDQEHLYRDHNPDVDIIALPKGLRGITHARQWLIDNYDEFFMIDDDIYQVRRNYAEKGEYSYVKEPETVYAIIEQSHNIARLLGAKMYGFPNTRQPIAYISHVPFTFTGYFNNSYCGFLKGHGLNYNLTMGEAEDYYISLLNAHKNRYGFFDERFTFVTKDNFVGDGGVCEYRTNEMMLENTIKLRKLFGEAVKIKKATGIKSKIHLGERSVQVPF